ncbi:zinc finger protein 414 isoform X1 [Centroberyx gerrardi]|uniref:zinc finger protein 414 n=1 Tax=Centroberyx gerrardi TaxID=166262 RepID=UPI003AB04C5B
MMSSGSAAPPQAVDNGKDGNRRTSCPLYGCKRVYTDMDALESHIKDHEIPAQSLPGKVLLCSTIGCSGSFPSMQKLMEHMRNHHKPNMFFLCESCRAKLRSYRGLLTHLHTCSKVPRGKMRAADPTPPPMAKPSTSPTATDHDTPQQDPVSTPLQISSQIQSTEVPPPAGVSQPDPAAAPLLNPPCLSNQGPSSPQLDLQQLTEAASQSQSQIQTSNPSSSLSPDGQTATTDPLEPQGQHQPQTKSPQPVHPAPGLSPHSPPGSTTVWRKNQGPSSNKRILWEHTRGRYRCVQCGYSAANRRDMTSHINTQHSVSKPAGDTVSPVANT